MLYIGGHPYKVSLEDLKELGKFSAISQFYTGIYCEDKNIDLNNLK